MSGHDGSFVAPDPWLAQTLGIPTFVLRGSLPPDPRAIASALEDFAGGGNAFVSAKCPVSAVAKVALLEAAGFRVVDTQITLEAQANGLPRRSTVETRLARPEDRTGVLEIAGTCFRYSRFHQDARIGRDAANMVKRRWAENCLDGQRGDEVLVAIIDTSVTGFLVAKKDVEDARTVAVIDLVAVTTSRQGQGIGESLVHAFITRWQERAEALRVGTQVANAASIRLYERCGFRFFAASYVLHAHVRHGRIV